MIELIKTTNLDKEMLVKKIGDQFLNVDHIYFKRKLLEFFDEKGIFIGDNLIETSFKLRENQSPLIYEVSGPYDSISNQYATIGKVYQDGKMIFQCDLKDGIIQRTAAMTWLYLEKLNHSTGNILLIGAGKLALEISAYLKYFVPGMEQIVYQDIEQKPDFEKELKKLGVVAIYQESGDFSLFDTIIMATNTKFTLINLENISSVKPGTVIISLCTTSQIGEIQPEVYGLKDVNIFLDYDLTKTFTSDMRKANEFKYLDLAILFQDVLVGKTKFNTRNKINLVRLTGTPMQNIAVIDLVM